MQGTERRRDGDKNPRTTQVRPRSARQQNTPRAAGARLAMLLMLGWLALLAWGAWAQRLPLPGANPAPAGSAGWLARRLVGTAMAAPQIAQAGLSLRLLGHRAAAQRGAGGRRVAA